jgi:hypothetical protein
MDNLDDLTIWYNNYTNVDKHEYIYKFFKFNASNNQKLLNHFNLTSSEWVELAYSYSWYLLVKEMPNTFNFLEIGVYKGRILSLIKLLANDLQKKCEIVGVTPLSTSGDKFSSYEDIDYLKEIQKSFEVNNLLFDDSIKIIKGFSQENNIISKAGEHGLYNIIFIDGSHDYPIVCSDIINYSVFLKKDGYLVMDDASYFVENPYTEYLDNGNHYYGYVDVGKAIKDYLDTNTNFKYCFTIGHNRIWKKIV